MPFSDKSYNLRIELDTHNCELSAEEIAHFEQGLRPLRKPVESFPVSDLYITVTFQPRSNTYRVNTALVLSGQTLAAGDIDPLAYTALERCVRKLVRRLDAYKDSLEAADERSKHQKGTLHEVIPQAEPDTELLNEAVEQQDYGAFRRAMYVYEEPLRKRIGRWVGRYPEIDRRIGEDLKLNDMVEEVFLNALERWDERPRQMRVGEWLEQLIDPSVRLLAEHPSRELESISFARTLRDM